MTTSPTRPTRPQPHRGLDITRVHAVADAPLGRLQARNVTATLPHVITQLEASGVLANLRAANTPEAATRAHLGFQFSDSDLYKTLEAIGWEICRTATTDFDAFIADSVALLRAAQHADGYLNSWGDSASSPGHWVDLTWGHELYCGGHLVQAAVALARAGRPDLLGVARAWADLVVVQFADKGFCGHAIAETALVELYRETGHQPYLDVAAKMVDRHGAQQLPPAHFEARYFQDHLPPREAHEAVGHAVRQLYFDAGVADVAHEKDDQTLLPALFDRWTSAHDTKMYLTGAMGSRHRDESFGDPYELPPDRAYAETCAAIADLMLSWRLLLATGDAKYADAIERVAHNALPASLSADGTKFFYSNPLQLRSTHHGEPNAPSDRVSWYDCACCPPNIARTIASLGAYLATVADDVLHLWQWADVDIELPDEVGSGVLRVRTTETGARLELDGELAAGKVVARVPSWAGGGMREVQLSSSAELEFDQSPRFVQAHPKNDAVRGCLAVMAGPVVWCAEQADNPDLEELAIDPSTAPRRDGEHVVVKGWRRENPSSPYSAPGAPRRLEEREIRLVPYRDWGNRNDLVQPAMRVWLPTAAD